VGDKSGWELKYVSRGMLLNHLHILRELGKITSKTMDHVETEYGTSMRPGNIDELCKKYYPEQKND
jgi:hypothetical protein